MQSTVSPTAPNPALLSPDPSGKHAFMLGNFAPVDGERTVGELPIRGALPKELNGALLRNGPNPVTAVTDQHHWFVGDGMLHSVRFEEGRALGYQNRWIRTKRIETQRGLAAAPSSPHSMSIGSGSIHVIEHAGHLLAPGEVGLPYEVDRDANTLREYDFGGALHSNMTGHPKIDPSSGEMVFFGYDFGPVNLRYHVADRLGRLTKTLEIPTKGPTMMHDFAVTVSRVIFFDLPVVFDIDLVAAGYPMPYRWDADYGARIGVMRRDGDGTDLRWFEIPLCYVYHIFNAYDHGESVVIDLVEHAHTFQRSEDGPENAEASPCVRWELHVKSGHLTRTVLDVRGQEFPRIDPRRITLQHRYGYAVHNPFAASGPAALIKHDFVAGTQQLHPLPAGCAPSEGSFVPIGAGEDEGYVLAMVWNPQRSATDVHVLDAQRWTDDPVAVVELPVRVPFGFHGDFIPDR